MCLFALRPGRVKWSGYTHCINPTKTLIYEWSVRKRLEHIECHMAGGRCTAKIERTHSNISIAIALRFEHISLYTGCNIYMDTFTHRAIVQPSKRKLEFLFVCAHIQRAHGTSRSHFSFGSRSNTKKNNRDAEQTRCFFFALKATKTPFDWTMSWQLVRAFWGGFHSPKHYQSHTSMGSYALFFSFSPIHKYRIIYLLYRATYIYMCLCSISFPTHMATNFTCSKLQEGKHGTHTRCVLCGPTYICHMV